MGPGVEQEEGRRETGTGGELSLGTNKLDSCLEMLSEDGDSDPALRV